MCHDTAFILVTYVPQITDGKQNGNRNKKYWKKRYTIEWNKLKSVKFSLWKIIVLAEHGVNVFPLDHRYRSLPFFTVQTIHYQRNLKVNLSKIIGIDAFVLLPRVWQYFCTQLSRTKEGVTQNSVIVHEINKCDSEWCIISLQIFGKEVFLKILFSKMIS